MLESGFYNMDCMDALKEMPDGYFDLAVVDPPYGIGAGKYTRGGTQHGKSVARCKEYAIKEWDSDAPPDAYFVELMRISRNQIIFGANHFISRMPRDASCWIVWDKQNGNNDYADCELAWTSFDKAVRKFTFRWQGMLQGNMREKEVRIHPTQKPVALYRWILQTFAEKGDRILDTHVGSASSLIACEQMGFEYVGFEIDRDYFMAARGRMEAARAQQPLFNPYAAGGAKQAERLDITDLLAGGASL